MNDDLLIYNERKRKSEINEEDINREKYRKEKDNHKSGMRAIGQLSDSMTNKKQELADMMTKQESRNNELLAIKDSLDIRDFESALDYQKERYNIDLSISSNNDEINKLESEIKNLKSQLTFMESWVKGVSKQMQSAKDFISTKADSININI